MRTITISRGTFRRYIFEILSHLTKDSIQIQFHTSQLVVFDFELYATTIHNTLMFSILHACPRLHCWTGKQICFWISSRLGYEKYVST